MKPLLNYQWTTAIIGLIIAVVILFLIRRDVLHVKRSMWWIGIALVIVLMGFFPLQVAQLGVLLGVNYPPILVLTVGMGLILIKILSMDLERSHQERMLRRLTQKIAMIEELQKEITTPKKEPGSQHDKSGFPKNLSDNQLS